MMNIKRMICCAFLAAMCTSSFAQNQEEWKLVWSDEFNINGRPDSTVWNYEIGFQRNHEDQWYQPANAYCKGGCLVIEAKKEKKERKNPGYDKNSQRWPQNVENIRYTSALLNTAQKKEFLYGRVEVRAKIPTASGAWPAIWLLGRGMEWPSMVKLTSWSFIASKAFPISLQMLVGERSSHTWLAGTAKPSLSVISPTETANGLRNSISGEWIGTKSPSASI